MTLPDFGQRTRLVEVGQDHAAALEDNPGLRTGPSPGQNPAPTPVPNVGADVQGGLGAQRLAGGRRDLRNKAVDGGATRGIQGQGVIPRAVSQLFLARKPPLLVVLTERLGDVERHPLPRDAPSPRRGVDGQGVLRPGGPNIPRSK